MLIYLFWYRPIKLVVAKCWDPNPKGYFTIPRTEPVRPIDPGAWVAHTAAIRGEGFPPRPPSATTLTSTSSSLASTLPDTERKFSYVFNDKRQYLIAFNNRYNFLSNRTTRGTSPYH